MKEFIKNKIIYQNILINFVIQFKKLLGRRRQFETTAFRNYQENPGLMPWNGNPQLSTRHWIRFRDRFHRYRQEITLHDEDLYDFSSIRTRSLNIYLKRRTAIRFSPRQQSHLRTSKECDVLHKYLSWKII